MPSLGKDLAAIRNKNGLSIEDVQQATKVPQHILRSIEDDSIFKQMEQNTTYTRSYVRSYAKAIGVKENDIVRALDQQETGSYDGHLKPEDTVDTTEDESAETGTENEVRSSGEPAEKKKKKQSEKKSEKKAKAKKSSAGSAVSSLDWVDVGRKAKPAQSKSRVWSGLLIIVLVVALLAAGFLLYNYYSQDSSPEPSTGENPSAIEPENPSDSLRESLIANNNQPAPADTTPAQRGTLGDTLTIAIHAANGKLEPVRIYTDILGKQNPYWVPEGDTIRFNFVNTVRVRAVNQYDRLQILFNGHIIQNYYQQYYNPETGMIEFDRSVFESNPQWRTPGG